MSASQTASGRSATIEQVGRDRQIVAAVGGAWRATTSVPGHQAHLAHQALDPPARMPPSRTVQFRVDPWRAIDPPEG
jgi:hypothetical protein